MKIAAMTLMAAVVGVAAEPGQHKLAVYLLDSAAVPLHVEGPAQALAAKMFATIGIRLRWRIGEPPRTTTPSAQHIFIELTTDTPANRLPGAMAYAKPYEGVYIRVFYDRIHSEVVPRSVLLAHVLVHEITHVLQGVARHSDSGVMKAVWTYQDHLQMRKDPLPFTPHDVELIHLGLARQPRLTLQNK
jgi:hypothetical protein